VRDERRRGGQPSASAGLDEPGKASSLVANILIRTSMFYLLLSRASMSPETRESCKRCSERVRKVSNSEARLG
jgi:hypothetical protein